MNTQYKEHIKTYIFIGKNNVTVILLYIYLLSYFYYFLHTFTISPLFLLVSLERPMKLQFTDEQEKLNFVIQSYYFIMISIFLFFCIFMPSVSMKSLFPFPKALNTLNTHRHSQYTYTYILTHTYTQFLIQMCRIQSNSNL